MGDFTRDLLYYGGINAYSGSMKLPGNVVFEGSGSYMGSLTVDTFVTGNANIPDFQFSTLTVAGNIVSGGVFAGNGALLSGVPPPPLPAIARMDIIGNVTAPGNVTAKNFYGNGSLLTGAVASLPSRANIDIRGNVYSFGNATILGQVNAGNVDSSYLIGNGSLLTGVPIGVPSVINADIIGNVTSPGNITAGGGVVVGGNIGVPAGAYLFGNAAFMTGVPPPPLPAIGRLDIIGNVTAPGNVSAQYFFGNGSGLTGTTVTLPSTTNIDITGNVVSLGNATVLGQVNVTGNVSATNFIGNGALVTGVRQTIPSVINADIIGNVTAPGNIIAGGKVIATGNIAAPAGSYFIGNGALITGIPPVSIPRTANIDIIGNVTASGNIIAQYFSGNGFGLTGLVSTLPSTGNIDIVGNVTAPGNVTVLGQVDVVGNVLGAYLFGNGNLLTDVTQTLPSVARIDVIGNIISSGYVIAGGKITAGGNIVGAYLVGNGALLTGVTLVSLPRTANIDIIGNVTAPGDISVAGQVNVVGNVAGRVFIGNAALLENVNVTYGGTTITPEQGPEVFTNNLAINSTQVISVNVSDAGLNFAINRVNNPGYLINLNPLGVVRQVSLNGYLIVPKGYVANTQARLAIADGQAPVGTLLSETDTGNVFLLTATPSNTANNWLEVGTGNTFHVNSVFGRAGDVIARSGDYADNTIVLSKTVGDVPAGNTLSEALTTLSSSKANITLGGNITANYFIGDGSGITGLKGVSAIVPPTGSLDIKGNVTSPGNMRVGGRLVSVGNVKANFFKGNGAAIYGMNPAPPPLTGTVNIDIVGNATVPGFMTCQELLCLGGAGTNTFTAGKFIGNGALLSQLKDTSYPPTSTMDVMGNVTAPGSITASRVAVTGDVVLSTGYLRGNGALMTGINPRNISGGILKSNLSTIPGVTVFTTDTLYDWGSSGFGDPENTSIGGVFAQSLGPAGVMFPKPVLGYTLYYNVPGVGGLVWNMFADYSKDFVVKFSMGCSVSGGGSGTFWVSVGGRDSGYNIDGRNLNNGALTAVVADESAGFPALGTVYYNGSQVPGSTQIQGMYIPPVTGILAGPFYPYTFSIRTIRGRRYLTLTSDKLGSVYAAADVTFWNPVGKFLAIGGSGPVSSSSPGDRYVNSVNLTYI